MELSKSFVLWFVTTQLCRHPDEACVASGENEIMCTRCQWRYHVTPEMIEKFGAWLRQSQ